MRSRCQLWLHLLISSANHMYGIDYCAYTTVLLKSAHEWSTLYTSLSIRGVGVLSSIPAFNHERVPMSHLQSSKQIIGQAITHNGATSSFEVCTQHSKPHHVTMTMQCSPMCVATLSTCTTQNCLIINLRWSTRWSFLPQMCTSLEAIQEIGPKVRSGHSFVWLWYIYMSGLFINWGLNPSRVLQVTEFRCKQTDKTHWLELSHIKAWLNNFV